MIVAVMQWTRHWTFCAQLRTAALRAGSGHARAKKGEVHTPALCSGSLACLKGQLGAHDRQATLCKRQIPPTSLSSSSVCSPVWVGGVSGSVSSQRAAQNTGQLILLRRRQQVIIQHSGRVAKWMMRAATGGDRSFASQGALEEQQRDHWATARSALSARAHRHGSMQRIGHMHSMRAE